MRVIITLFLMLPAVATGHPSADHIAETKLIKQAYSCLYANQKKIEKYLTCKALCEKQKKAGYSCHCAVLILNECRQPHKVDLNRLKKGKK